MLTSSKTMEVLCTQCGAACGCLSGNQVYRNRPDLGNKWIYVCPVCPDARIGCHPGTNRPLGTTAGPELRKARMLLHNERLDPLWRGTNAARHQVYAFLADALDIPRERCHVGEFTIQQCRKAWVALKGQTPTTIRAWWRLTHHSFGEGRCLACGKKNLSDDDMRSHARERSDKGDISHQVMLRILGKKT